MRNKVWFNSGGRRRNFKRSLKHLKDQPAVYLEIGVFRGESLAWVAKNILTHPESRGLGVDPWEPGCMGRRWTGAEINENYRLAQKAIRKWNDRVELAKTTSQEFFSAGTLQPGTVDAIYLDGEHDPEPLTADFRAAWELLKVGGVLIIDDYKARTSKIPQVVEALAVEYGARWEELFRNYQIGFRKIA
jgi:hypothetical protein